MNKIQEIDRKIAELQREHDDAEGTPTEIYTRIVGYYRSLKNWNKGKREEYDHRLTFSSQDEAPVRSSDTRLSVDVSEEIDAEHSKNNTDPHVEGASPRFLYFYRESCPNCPPVKQRLDQSSLEGTHINVDTESGIDQAITYQILATPTVVLLNDDGTIHSKLTSLSQVDQSLAAVV